MCNSILAWSRLVTTFFDLAPHAVIEADRAAFPPAGKSVGSFRISPREVNNRQLLTTFDNQRQPFAGQSIPLFQA